MALIYRLGADFVVVLHAAYVLFVIFGFLAVMAGILRRWEWVRNPWFRGCHLAMIVTVVAEAWLGITCPLTTWEQQLRQLAGQETYDGAFIANVVHNLLFYDGPQWVFTLSYTLFGVAVAASFYLAPPRRRSAARS